MEDYNLIIKAVNLWQTSPFHHATCLHHSDTDLVINHSSKGLKLVCPKKECDWEQDIPWIIVDNYKTVVSTVPEGIYCHGVKDGHRFTCPYWEIVPGKETQNNGYCGLLRQGDWEEKGSGLLWDQVKDCDVNYKDDWKD